MMSHDERFLNLGKKVVLNSIGKEVVVKELSMLQTLEVLRVVPNALDVFQESRAASEMGILTELLDNPKTREILVELSCALFGLSTKEVESLSLSDFLRLLSAVKETLNWEEFKELFFQVVPRESLAQITGALQKRTPEERKEEPQSSSTPSSEDMVGVTSTF